MLLNEAVTSSLSAPMQEAGLTLGTFELLSAIKGGRERLNQAEIAERLGITPPSLCESVRAATQRGLVEQVLDPKDRRAKIVTLTPSGKAAIDKVQRALVKLEKDISKSFAQKDLDQACRVLERVVNHISPENSD